MTRTLSTLALLLGVPTVGAAGPWGLVSGGKSDEMNVVCTVPFPAGDAAADVKALQLPDGTSIPAQVVGPSVLQPQGSGRYLVFVLPKLKAGEKLAVGPVAADQSKTPPEFAFSNKTGEYSDLVYGYGKRPVLRYSNAPHDPKNHYLTFKPFHHVFDPVKGETLLTSGAVPLVKENLFPHHRGLFFGWNKSTYDGKTADIWHGTDGVYSQHDKVLSEEAGRALGRQRSAISWHGKDGQTFVTEERELTAYAASGGTLIDFAGVLKTDRPSVKLDGDPQHAGFHFRASMEVAQKTAKETYYLRPDGKGKPGETRNWDPKGKDPKTVNLPWDAISFVVGGKRYTVVRMNHPDTPGEARGSERDYGRFGDYFEYELTPEKPLRVKYRLWVQEGEMTVEQCDAMSKAFVAPPEVKLAGAR
ncbi:MAG: hypothetical protein JWO38_3145 [Gemmataceae bacterium]|nr:hypothetical protein [Gemmataceae bacterium]